MAAAAPFAIKAAPWIAKGAAMLGGSPLGKKLSGPSKEQKAAMAGQEEAANTVGQYAKPLVQGGTDLARQGAGDLGAAGGYYRNILSSRQAGREALAPEMATAMDFYRGAEGRAKRTMRGGGRDLALAELSRQRVGQFASMLPAARRMAAEGLTGTGGTALEGGTAMTGQGVGAATAAGQLRSGMFGNATTIENQRQAGGKAWGNILYDAASMIPWGKGSQQQGGLFPGGVGRNASSD